MIINEKFVLSFVQYQELQNILNSGKQYNKGDVLATWGYTSRIDNAEIKIIAFQGLERVYIYIESDNEISDLVHDWKPGQTMLFVDSSPNSNTYVERRILLCIEDREYEDLPQFKDEVPHD